MYGFLVYLLEACISEQTLEFPFVGLSYLMSGIHCAVDLSCGIHCAVDLSCGSHCGSHSSTPLLQVGEGVEVAGADAHPHRNVHSCCCCC